MMRLVSIRRDKRALASSLCLPCEDSEEVAVCRPGGGSHWGTKLAITLILDFPDSRIVRNKFLSMVFC